ncbi:MAG: CHAT domain-containing protein [Terriglobales bacterium]
MPIHTKQRPIVARRRRAASPKPKLEPWIERLAALPSATARRQAAVRQGRRITTTLLARLDDLVAAQVRIDVARAAAWADAALALAAVLPAPAAKGHAYRAKANALYAQSRHAAAIVYHRRATRQFERGREPLQVARTLSASMLPLLLSGHYDEALAAAERARALFEAAGERGRITRLEINIGNVLYRQDRFGEALACYQRAYARLSRARGAKDVEAMAAVLSNIAVCQISLNDFRDALNAYRRARAFCLRHGMPLLVFQADYNIAYLYYLRGEYTRAIEGLRRAREACAASGDAYHAALSNLDLSEIYLELNLSAEAGELAEDARQRFERLEFGYESAKALANRAIALGREGEPLLALELFAAARQRFVREKNLVWPWLTDLYQALILHETGRHFEARRLARAAFAFFRDSVLAGKAALCQLLLARVALRLGEHDEARRECLAALERLNTIESPALRHQAYFLLARIEQARGDRAAAYESCQQARLALESLRGGLRGEELKMAFMKNKVEVYELLVDLCLEGVAGPSPAAAGTRSGAAAAPAPVADFEEAFGYIEQAKSRSLMEMMFRPARRALKTADAAGQSQLVRRVRELREQLNWYYHRIEVESLSQTFSRQRIERLQEQARGHEGELLRALRETPSSEESPLAPATAPVSLETIRAALPAGGLLLEYFQSGDQILLARLGAAELEIIPVTLASRVHELMRLLRFHLAKANLGPRYLEQFGENLLRAIRVHLADLYTELLAPVADHLRARHLVIVPHGALHYLPFHALYDGAAYVADRFCVSYAPSASIHAFCQAQPPRQNGEALVLGVADRKAPLIAEEARLVAGLWPDARLLEGEQATYEALRRHAAQARVLHIAAHGTFRRENPVFSSIHLSRSRLSLYDLYQMRLPVELATLSGCATGLNVVTEGDELLGLVRGLLGAGARSLLLTLWDVNDRATLEFMAAFYRVWRAGESKAEAARQAMLAVRRQWPHPYFWAPFVLIGASI